MTQEALNELVTPTTFDKAKEKEVEITEDFVKTAYSHVAGEMTKQGIDDPRAVLSQLRMFVRQKKNPFKYELVEFMNFSEGTIGRELQYFWKKK